MPVRVTHSVPEKSGQGVSGLHSLLAPFRFILSRLENADPRRASRRHDEADDRDHRSAERRGPGAVERYAHDRRAGRLRSSGRGRLPRFALAWPLHRDGREESRIPGVRAATVLAHPRGGVPGGRSLAAIVFAATLSTGRDRSEEFVVRSYRTTERLYRCRQVALGTSRYSTATRHSSPTLRPESCLGLP